MFLARSESGINKGGSYYLRCSEWFEYDVAALKSIFKNH